MAIKWLAYEIRQIDKSALQGFLHETDRQLRKYLKTGHILRERKEEAWAAPYISAVLASDAKAIAEAALELIEAMIAGKTPAEKQLVTSMVIRDTTK